VQRTATKRAADAVGAGNSHRGNPAIPLNTVVLREQAPGRIVEMCAGRAPSIVRYPYSAVLLIFRRLFHLVDDHDVDGRLGRFQLQSQLLREGGEQIRSSIGIVGGGRWRATTKRACGRIGRESQREVVPFGKA
jgi:hypothetical protein